jgi:HlyD family secretion protein
MMRSWCVVSILLLAACSSSPESPSLERVAPAPTVLAVEASGSLRSAKATPLVVPGEQWSARQLTWVLPDGSAVKEGDVVARFSAEQSKMELAKALVELQRNALMRAGKSAELGGTQGKLEVDLSQVAGLLGIAHRYANATAGALAQNAILDAVQDETFLGVKQGALLWNKNNSTMRGAAELALVDAQRSTNDVLVKQKHSDLEALELHAPHAGLLMLEANWSGEKPRVGQSMWAGNNFASLPDIANMEAEIALPQAEAQGIKEGLEVELTPLGVPEQKATSKVSWVAAAAALRGRDSPVKYLTMKVPIPVDAVTRFHWLPGQRFTARIVLLRSDNALTVPNIALENNGDTSTIAVRIGGHVEERKVRLGVRGPSRSEVLEGLQAGDDIVLSTHTPPAGDKDKPVAAVANPKSAP